MSAPSFQDFVKHAGHKLECIAYGPNQSATIECRTCNELIYCLGNEANPIQHIALTATRFVWTCPSDYTEHIESTLKTFVHCGRCNRDYEVMDISYARA